ncbi:MAG: HAD family phosphatase [Sphingobium sp.]|nr:HAD family phosphatase [Sphingobium sp.]
MTPKAIIFDFDGVIADSEIVSARMFSEALTAAGLPTTLDEAVERYTGYHRADNLIAIAAHWGERTPHDLAERLNAHADALFAVGLTPVPGATEFIGSVSHLPLAIGSSSRTAYLNKHLADFDLADAFGAHVYSGSEHVARGKPHPDIYLHAAQALGVHPSETVIIEDSPVGARAAVAAGARVIGFTGGSHARPSLTERLAAEGVEIVLPGYGHVAAHLGIGERLRTAM